LPRLVSRGVKMMRSNLYRSATVPFFVGALAAAVLAFAPSAAFAQHGGGGGGHASSGGGGGHFGSGGGSASSHASAPAASHSSAKPATRSAPVANSRPPVATSARPAATSTGAASARQTLFGTPAPSGSGTAVAIHAQNATPRTTVIGFPPSESNAWQATPAHSGPVSFSGQGHEIWQDSPSRSGNSVVNAAPAASSQVRFAGPTPAAAVRPTPPHKIFFPGGSSPVIFVPAFGFFGSGFGFGYFGNGFGCDPFFGWGFNQGFGCNGFGYGLGYGYSGYYGPGYGYNYAPGYDSSLSVGQSSSDSSGDASNDAYGAYSAASPSLQNSDAAPNDAASPNDGDAATSVNAAPSAAAATAPPPTTIYLKDGSSYEVMSYWLDAGKLHYITNYGGETSIDMSQLDLQRTVDENAAHGGSFTLLPAPATDAAPAPPVPQQ